MKELRNGSYGHVLKYTSLFGGVQVLSIMIGLVRNKAMAMILGAGGMGFNALFTSMQNFASQCTNLGISFGAVPRLSELHERQEDEMLRYYIQVIRLWSIIAALLGVVFCVVVSPLVNLLSFTWGDHTLHYAMLALAVAMGAITGGETAIMKATRQLGKVAKAQILTVIAALFVSVPLYYCYGHSGVVPAIVLIAFVTMIITLSYSYYSFPFRFYFCRSMLRDGVGMIRLGMAFIVAAAIGSASEMAIRSYLNVVAGMDDVGLYNAAFMITITYSGLVFSAMETDYFPRLSGVANDMEVTNDMVNKQIEVSLLLLAPMLVALLAGLPVLIPMLFSSEFLPMVEMAQIAVLAMYFKVLTMPVAYITLARRLSLSYLLLETSYFVVLVVAIVCCYQWWGLWGTGLAIVIAHVAENLLVMGYAMWKYGYRITSSVVSYATSQMVIGFTAYAVTLLFDGWGYWITEAALTIVSTAYSVYVLRQKTRLWERLTKRFRI
jgi:O-antigen/teichoic acid export membrane protein